MQRFSEMQENAKDMALLLTVKYSKQPGCFSVLSFLTLQQGNNRAFEDAVTISRVASSFDDMDAQNLQLFLEKEYSFNAEVIEFKNKVIIGLYLLVASRYTDTVSNFLNNHFIALIKEHLGVKVFSKIDPQLFTSSLEALSQFATYIFHNIDTHKMYDELDSRLGESIKVDIYNLKRTGFVEDDSLYGAYTGVKNYLGFN